MYSTACPGSASKGVSRIYILEPCLGALRGQRHPAVSIDSSFDTRLGLRVVLRQVSSNFLDFVFSRLLRFSAFVLCSAGELRLSFIVEKECIVSTKQL